MDDVATEPAALPKIELTSTDLGAIITVNEARAAKGLPPLAADGDLTIAEFKAKHSGTIAEAAQAESGAAPPQESP